MRFSIEPGVAITVHRAKLMPKEGPAAYEKHEHVEVHAAAEYKGRSSLQADDLPTFTNLFEHAHNGELAKMAYLTWSAEGGDTREIAKRCALTDEPLLHGEEADYMRTRLLEGLADLAQKMMGGRRVFLACECDPRSAQPRAPPRHACKCHARTLATRLNQIVEMQYAGETARGAIAEDASRRGAAAEPSPALTSAAPRTRARGWSEAEPLIARRGATKHKPKRARAAAPPEPSSPGNVAPRIKARPLEPNSSMSASPFRTCSARS